MKTFNDQGLAPADSPDRIFPKIAQLPTGGPLDSRLINSTISRLVFDLDENSRRVGEAIQSLRNLRNIVIQAGSRQRDIAMSLEDERVLRQIAAFRSNSTATYTNDFKLLRGVTHKLKLSTGGYTAFPLQRRARLDGRLGVVTLPYTNMASAFRRSDPEDSATPISRRVNVQVNEVSEIPATHVDQTDVHYAYSGETNRFWLLRAAYPLASGVTEVEFEVVIQVPQQYVRQFNCLRCLPAPEGQVDIVAIKYSEDTATPDTDLDGFESLNEAQAKMWLFETTEMASLSVRLRSRRWTEEGAHKVFYVGIEDLDLQLIEFDDTYSKDDPEDDGCGMFIEIEIPEVPGISVDNYVFHQLTRVRTSPAVSTSKDDDRTNNGIRIRLFDSPEMTNLLWDSTGGTTVAPSTPVTVTGTKKKLYATVVLDRRANSLSPVLETLQIDYTAKKAN